MRGRPWLEALKGSVREGSANTDQTLEKISEALPLEGCERCESLADAPRPALDIRVTEKVGGSWGEEERRLMATGWKPKERGGLVIWANPKTGFYYSQEVALHSLQRRLGGEA